MSKSSWSSTSHERDRLQDIISSLSMQPPTTPYTVPRSIYSADDDYPIISSTPQPSNSQTPLFGSPSHSIFSSSPVSSKSTVIAQATTSVSSTPNPRGSTHS